MERSAGGAEQRDGTKRRMTHIGTCHEASDGAKRQTTPVVSTMRRLDNGDDCRQGRRGYCVGVGGGSVPGMTTVASDGCSGDDKKSLWL